MGASTPVRAQSASDAQIKALQEQINQLQRAVNQLMATQAQSNAAAKAAQDQAQQAQTKATQAQSTASQAQTTASQAQITATQAAAKAGSEELDANGHRFLEKKKGSALTFYTPGGEITGYGNLDVSLDAASKDIKSRPTDAAGNHPVGNFGWMPDISTNNSYLGVRGFQTLGSSLPSNFVYQLEAGIDISAAPGTRETNSNESNQVNGALFSRNSFIGLSDARWGALKIGKTDAPYKTSTASLNPFAGQWGDYAVIMGNTGGDNRVEFGTRLTHAAWYESPNFGGFTFNFLFSPGQNRSSDSDNLAAGESDCAGGNIPESGADVPAQCNDGSFSNAVSANLAYKNGPLYVTAAGEYHNAVNRSSDITAIYGATSVSALTPSQLAQFNQDVADEWATKFAAQYTFSTKTMIGGIVEYMHRDVPSDLDFQNERTRWGTWLVAGQEITPVDNVYLGWAHAFRTPGDPGQHNSGTLTTSDGLGTFAPNKNQADMVTLAYKHNITENLTWYTDWAMTVNGPSAHYDLGAGGRSVTTDCHDANGGPGGADATPQCWTGTTLMGVSTGLDWRF